MVGEETAAAAARRHGVAAVSLRLSWVTYPGDERRREARETFDPATADPSGNCWSSVDVRDVVAAIEAAIDPDASVEGHKAVLIVGAENGLDRRDTAATIEAVHGELPAECDLDGDESVFDCSKGSGCSAGSRRTRGATTPSGGETPGSAETGIRRFRSGSLDWCELNCRICLYILKLLVERHHVAARGSTGSVPERTEALARSGRA
ncbi:hypothetical protein GCM10009060_12800 [Halorubrum trapanicum]|uniref:hypothetical protein n=1 Tax=Halorubrum trapanicum TaxID=29284 RepID=UPI0031D2891E